MTKPRRLQMRDVQGPINEVCRSFLEAHGIAPRHLNTLAGPLIDQVAALMDRAVVEDRADNPAGLSCLFCQAVGEVDSTPAVTVVNGTAVCWPHISTAMTPQTQQLLDEMTKHHPNFTSRKKVAPDNSRDGEG